MSKNIGAPVTVEVKDQSGKAVGSLKLDAEIFSREPNIALMHQVVNAQLAARRSGTQSTKTRAEVEGGTAKPWRQKGTGRARQGSTRAPHFAGGGVAMGPKPRKYDQRTPKKMVRQALFCALSDRAADGNIVVVDSMTFDVPSTKEAIAALRAWKIERPVLVVLGDDDENAYMSFRNLPEVHVAHEAELNTYDVLRHDYVVFTKETLPRIDETNSDSEKSSNEVEAS